MKQPTKRHKRMEKKPDIEPQRIQLWLDKAGRNAFDKAFRELAEKMIHKSTH